MLDIDRIRRQFPITRQRFEVTGRGEPKPLIYMDHGARIIVDGAQLLAHAPIDVRPDGDPEHIDFFAGAGHKACAPFGSAFLFGPRDLLDEAPPYIPAGGTVIYVTENEAYCKGSPDRHQGGTPNIAGAVAFAAALRFLEEVGMDEVRSHERVLVERAMDGLKSIDGVRVLGHPDPEERIGALALDIEGVPHEPAATIPGAAACKEL